jgi:predicted DNA-binding transcriptional regulator AlpA
MNESMTRLRPKAAAAFLEVTVSCLAKWRMQNKGPRYRRLGERIIYYTPSDIQSWLNTCDDRKPRDPEGA